VKLKLLIGVLVFLIVLNLATIGSFVYMRWTGGRAELAPPAPPSPEDRMMGRPGRAKPDRPGPFRLRTEERAELGKLLAELRSETSDLERRIEELEGQVFEKAREETVDRGAVDSLLFDISTARLEISQIVVSKLLEAKSHLTPEQQELFYKALLRARSDSRMGGHRFRGERPFRRGNMKDHRPRGGSVRPAQPDSTP